MEKGKKRKNTKKKRLKDVKPGLFKGVRLELKKVTWPDKKMYSSILLQLWYFCVVVVLFFQLLNLGLSVVKGSV